MLQGYTESLACSLILVYHCLTKLILFTSIYAIVMPGSTSSLNEDQKGPKNVEIILGIIRKQ